MAWHPPITASSNFYQRSKQAAGCLLQFCYSVLDKRAALEPTSSACPDDQLVDMLTNPCPSQRFCKVRVEGTLARQIDRSHYYSAACASGTDQQTTMPCCSPSTSCSRRLKPPSRRLRETLLQRSLLFVKATRRPPKLIHACWTQSIFLRQASNTERFGRWDT